MPRATKIICTVKETPDELAHLAAERFSSITAHAAEQRGVARIAISGGSTPKAAFGLWASEQQPYRSRTPWDKLELYWVDERCVPPDHAESNYRMTREAMLSLVPIDPLRIFRIEGELDPEVAAARYESAIRNNLRLEGAELPRFDLVQLGMGEDGHTASLFPHTDAINELGRLVVPNHVPQKDAWRVTLTWPVINNAAEVFFLIEGAAKAEVLRDVLLGAYDPDLLPSQLIRPASGVLSFLLDQAAAAKLPSPTNGAGGRIEFEVTG